jgi:hypothetical protein
VKTAVLMTEVGNGGEEKIARGFFDAAAGAQQFQGMPDP